MTIRQIIDILSDAQVFDDHTVCDFCKYKGICGNDGDYDCYNGIALAVEEKLEEIK